VQTHGAPGGCWCGPHGAVFCPLLCPTSPGQDFISYSEWVPGVHSPALHQNLRIALKGKDQISKMREILSVSYSCFFLLGDINYQEFAKRLWGDIYFNPKT